YISVCVFCEVVLLVVCGFSCFVAVTDASVGACELAQQPRAGHLGRRVGRAQPWVLAVHFFFLQAEDGIRDSSVTGDQTCALPIFWYAGWADKLPQVLGGSNPVAGPYFNFTVPEPTGVVAVLAPDEPALLGLVSRLMPPLVGGNAVVAVASETQPLAAIELAEAIAASDLPGGVVNVLTGYRKDMAPILAAHMDVNAIDVGGADGLAPELEELAAENVKRLVRVRADSQSPWEIASFLELTTVWHPVGRGPVPAARVRAAGVAP